MSAHDAVRHQPDFSSTMTASSEKFPSSRRDWLVAVLITAALVGLHFFFLFHAGGFWRDEVNVINLAGSHSLAGMARDSFPILMPLLIHVWSAVGLAGSDLHLRILGVLIGLGLAGALWLAAWTTRRAPPLLSLALLGLNSTVIFWGDSLRAYGLGSFLIVLALAAMAFLLQRPSWGRAGILAVAAALSVQAMYHNAVFFASICLGGWLVCWLRKDKSAALKIFAVALAAALSLLPYFGFVWQWQHATAGIRPGFSLVAALGNLNTLLAFPLPQHVWVWALLALSVIGSGVAVFFRLPSPTDHARDGMSPTELRVFAGAILFSSLAGYFVFLDYAALITSPWYFLPLLALAAICFDIGFPLSSLPRLARTIVWGILIGTVGLAVPFAVRDLNCRFTNVDLVARRLTKEISPQDYVVVTPWYLGITFDRYYRSAAVWDTLPPITDHSVHRFDLAQTATANTNASQPVLDRITRTLQSGHRVWIVGWMSVPAPGRTAPTPEGRFLAEHSRSFEPVDLKITGPTSDYEDVVLLLASGWKTNSP